MQGSVGERPASPFGGLPVSEIAILAGVIGLVVGLLDKRGPAIIVGTIVCVLGVLEVTVREHFSGFRSHAALLAMFPAAAVMVAVAFMIGGSGGRSLLLVPVIPVFAVSFWLLRRRFQVARHARLTRPPSPSP